MRKGKLKYVNYCPGLICSTFFLLIFSPPHIMLTIMSTPSLVYWNNNFRKATG